MDLLFKLARPAIFRFDAEQAHNLSLRALKCGVVKIAPSEPDERLQQDLFGLKFVNPVGLAAGYDKNAEVIGPVLKLGFGFAEVGSLTPLAQPGNPKPRIFRLARDKGVINRLGFNNQGHEPALRRLEDFVAGGKKGNGIIGVNIGANKTSQDFIADYEQGLKAFWSVADYFTANISSPNTPGLRNLQARETLAEMLDRLEMVRQDLASRTKIRRPLLLKIAPDLDEGQMDDISDVINRSTLEGVIISNTTVARPESLQSAEKGEVGGLSGLPLFHSSTVVLAKMRQRLDTRLSIIGVGGVHDTNSAVEKIRAGASLVQFYSGMVYEGPGLANSIVAGLSAYLRKHRVGHVSELTATGVDEWASRPIQGR